MVLSLDAEDVFSRDSHILGPARLKQSRSLNRLRPPAFHCTDTDDSDSDSNDDTEDSDIDSPPRFHYEPDHDDTLQHTNTTAAAADKSSLSTALTIRVAPSPSPSHASSLSSPHAAVCFSPTTFFASPSFSSLLSTRAASVSLSLTPSSGSCASPVSSDLPCYSPRSSCVQPRVFAWKVEEAAVLFWERKNALTVGEAHFTNVGAGSSARSHSRNSSVDGEAAQAARLIHHIRHPTL